jgi:hypothetical protein
LIDGPGVGIKPTSKSCYPALIIMNAARYNNVRAAPEDSMEKHKLLYGVKAGEKLSF